ncbi:MAG: adenylyltransferase/cytidyltransferase family protein [Patescibacteria group bacterium]|jgi:cytidyltransferase-like protein
MKKVMAFGAFDILHPGHVDFFEQAKKHGDYLVVVVARDNTINQVKKHIPQKPQDERLEAVQNHPAVDRAVLGYEDDKYKIIQEIAPDVICLGYDQVAFTELLEAKLKEFDLNTKIVRLKPFHPEQYKSSKLNK